ncbi:MAG: hypothetical protein LC113_06795 [Acidobacteria bacterium]|nr:hypothetical protein [Acidobacteriota bacterium]
MTNAAMMAAGSVDLSGLKPAKVQDIRKNAFYQPADQGPGQVDLAS